MSVRVQLRSEVFDHALLPFTPATAITRTNLHKLALFTKSSRHRTFPMLSFADWQKWAGDTMALTSEMAWLYFETFDVICDVRDDRRLRFSEKELNAIAADSLGALREKSSVNIFQFMVFLYVQTYERLSLKQPIMTGEAEWPVHESARKRPMTDDRQPYYDRALSQENARIAFIVRHMSELLELLIDPDMYSNGDAVVCRAGAEALDFLLTTFKADHDGHSQPTPLIQVISTQPESQAAGYSKISNAFSLEKLSTWLQARLQADPVLVAGAATAEPYPLLVMHAPKTVISRLSKKTIIWDGSNVGGSQLYMYQCTGSSIYILASLQHVHISDCRHCVIVLGAVTGVVTLTRCRKVTIVAATRRITCSASEDCHVYVCTATSPLLLDGVHGIHIGPHNTSYAALKEHVAASFLDPRLNRWNTPFSAVSKGTHVAGYSLIPPSEFHIICIPIEQQATSEEECIPRPAEYHDAISSQLDVATSLHKALASLDLPDIQKEMITDNIESKFMEWLTEHGHIRQLNDLAAMGASPLAHNDQ